MHPLGVVPETAVDYMQSAGVLDLRICSVVVSVVFFVFGLQSDRADRFRVDTIPVGAR